MRRLAVLAAALTLGGLAGAVLLGCGASGTRAPASFRVDAIFDDAKGVIPGQQVKIAGARVGSVRDVTLTPDFKARVKMSVAGRFAPFHADAGCAIKPEGLIAENFVDCNPGTPAAGVLRPARGEAATVTVEHNTEPVSITDLFNIWRTPTADRLRVLLNELGAGVAGRGTDLNAILRRANPALSLARRALTLVNGQRAQLQGLIGATDPVVAELARRHSTVQSLIDHAATVTATTAAHSAALADSVRRLPALLGAARPALAQLDAVAASGTPVLDDARAAAPALNRVAAELGPFAAAGTPTLRKLGPALRAGNDALGHAAPVVSRLRSFTQAADPTGQLLNRLLLSLRDSGSLESLQSFMYNSAAASARYDAVSHLMPANGLLSTCSLFATQPVSGCSAWYPSGAARAAAHGRRRRHAATAPRTPAAPPPPPTRGAPAGPAPSTAPAASAPAAPARPLAPVGAAIQGVVGTVPAPVGKPLQTLLDYLLK